MSCTRCGSAELMHDVAHANVICTVCGTILQQSSIVNDIQFNEEANGATSLVGQYFSTDGQIGGKYAFSSRSVTIMKFKTRLVSVATSLHLPNSFVEKAKRFYLLCIGRGFSKGRRADVLAATLLFVVCRQEATPHLIIDFADCLGVSIHTIAGCLSEFLTKFDMHLPSPPPTLYLERFVTSVCVGEFEKNAALQAREDLNPDGSLSLADIVAEIRRNVLALAGTILMRLITDNIHTGRLPTGVVGASIFAALKILGLELTTTTLSRYLYISARTLEYRILDLTGAPFFKGTTTQELLRLSGLGLDAQSGLLQLDAHTALAPLESFTTDHFLPEPPPSLKYRLLRETMAAAEHAAASTPAAAVPPDDALASDGGGVHIIPFSLDDVPVRESELEHYLVTNSSALKQRERLWEISYGSRYDEVLRREQAGLSSRRGDARAPLHAHRTRGRLAAELLDAGDGAQPAGLDASMNQGEPDGAAAGADIMSSVMGSKRLTRVGKQVLRGVLGSLGGLGGLSSLGASHLDAPSSLQETLVSEEPQGIEYEVVTEDARMLLHEDLDW